MAKQRKQNKKSILDRQLRKYLSKKSADRIMAKITKMVKAGASTSRIQQVIVAMIAADCAAITAKAMVTGTGVRAGERVHGSPPNRP